MRTFRNVAFLLFAVAMFMGRQGAVFAFDPSPPDFEDCPSHCTCTVDEYNWNNVGIYCGDDPGVEVCPYALDACSYYCSVTLEDYAQSIYNYDPPISCMMHDLEGCTPYGLDPPTEATCECWCWQ